MLCKLHAQIAAMIEFFVGGDQPGAHPFDRHTQLEAAHRAHGSFRLYYVDTVLNTGNGRLWADWAVTGLRRGVLIALPYIGWLSQKHFAAAGETQPASDAPFEVRARTLSKVSGYAVFQRLRSLFREYWQTHKSLTTSDACRDSTRMHFTNMKDNELWTVEPMQFRMVRSSKSPLMYQYVIRLRVIR